MLHIHLIIISGILGGLCIVCVLGGSRYTLELPRKGLHLHTLFVEDTSILFKWCSVTCVSICKHPWFSNWSSNFCIVFLSFRFCVQHAQIQPHRYKSHGLEKQSPSWSTSPYETLPGSKKLLYFRILPIHVDVSDTKL